MAKKFPKSIEIEVFRGGTQTDSAGRKNEWTEAKLNEIVAGYTKTGTDVPACVSSQGHPDDNRPAVGYFTKFRRVGKTIKATLSDINPDFAEMLRNKTVKNLSIALRNNLSPRHIAFLGTMSPAIKNLESFAFSKKDEFTEHDFTIGENEFADFQTVNAFHRIGEVLQQIRDRKIEKDGLEKANEIISQFDIDMLKNMDPTPDTVVGPSFNEPSLKPSLTGDLNMPTEKEFKESQDNLKAANEKITALSAESKTFSEKAETEKTRADAAEKSIADAGIAALDKEFNEYAEGLVKDQKILPAEKEFVAKTMKTLNTVPSFDFTEKDGSVIKRTQLGDYKKMLDNKQVGNLFNEKFTNGDSAASTDDSEIQAATQKIMDEKGWGFTEASRHLRTTKPEMFKGVSFTESIGKQKV